MNFVEVIKGLVKKLLRISIGDSKPEEITVSVAAIEEDGFTENEWEAYYLTKGILFDTVDAERLYLRKLAGAGCSFVNLDDSQKKPLVQLSFKSPDNMSIEIWGNEGKIRHAIDKVDNITLYAEAIRESASALLAAMPQKE